MGNDKNTELLEQFFEWAEFGTSLFASFENCSGSTKINRDIKVMERKLKDVWKSSVSEKRIEEVAKKLIRYREIRVMAGKVTDDFTRFVIEENLEGVIEELAKESFGESKRSTKDGIKFGVKAAAAVISPRARLFMSPKAVKTLSKVGKVARVVGHGISIAKNFCANMEEFKDDDAVCRVVKAGAKTAYQTGGAIIGGSIGAAIGSVVPVFGTVIGEVVGTIIGEKIGVAVFDLITKPEETMKKAADAVSNLVTKSVETTKKVWGWFKSWW